MFKVTKDTSIQTIGGDRTVESIADTPTRCLVNSAPPVNTGTIRTGYWSPITFVTAGEHPVVEVVLRRQGRTKVIRTTEESIWYTSTKNIPVSGKKVLSRKTIDMRKGMSSAALLVKPKYNLTVSPFGVPAGFVFGDGTLGESGCVARLFGDKDEEMLKYFSMCSTYRHENKNGTKFVSIHALPKHWKLLPDLEESVSYLAGWLAGYIAADGTVNNSGAVSITSGNPAHLEHVIKVSNRVGVVPSNVREYARGAGGYAQDKSSYYLTFSAMDERFVILSKHREWLGRRKTSKNMVRWQIESITPTGEVALMYTPLEETISTFSLTQGVAVSNLGEIDGY